MSLTRAKGGDRVVDALLSAMTDPLDPASDIDGARETESSEALLLPGDFGLGAELAAKHAHAASLYRQGSAFNQCSPR